MLFKAIDEKIANANNINIAKITKVNDNTINCKIVINKIKPNGEEIQYPEFIQVPIITIQGGGTYLSMPVKKDDYCIIFYNDRCFDNWYFGKDFTASKKKRKNSFSDAIALVGLNPLNSAIGIPQTATFNGDIIHNGNIQVNGSINVTGGDVVADGISLKGHIHNGDSGGTTSAPIG